MANYLVVYGTRQTIVDASTESDAFRRFVEKQFPLADKRLGGGRVMPPIREEVTIRKATAADMDHFAGEELRKKRLLDSKGRMK